MVPRKSFNRPFPGPGESDRWGGGSPVLNLEQFNLFLTGDDDGGVMSQDPHQKGDHDDGQKDP